VLKKTILEKKFPQEAFSPRPQKKKFLPLSRDFWPPKTPLLERYGRFETLERSRLFSRGFSPFRNLNPDPKKPPGGRTEKTRSFCPPSEKNRLRNSLSPQRASPLAEKGITPEKGRTRCSPTQLKPRGFFREEGPKTGYNKREPPYVRPRKTHLGGRPTPQRCWPPPKKAPKSDKSPKGFSPRLFKAQKSPL